MRILVVYATVYGSTRQIAERIGARLGASGAHVEVRAVDMVGDVSRFDAFLVGSAIHDQAWLPEAQDFVQRHHALLSRCPVWLFSVGMAAALPPRMRALAMRQEHIVLASLPPVRPRGHHVFSGIVMPDRIPLRARMLFRLLGGRYGDYCDPKEADRWAAGIAGRLNGVAGEVQFSPPRRPSEPTA